MALHDKQELMDTLNEAAVLLDKLDDIEFELSLSPADLDEDDMAEVRSVAADSRDLAARFQTLLFNLEDT